MMFLWILHPNSGIVNRFAENIGGGPASQRGMMGKGIERPFDVKFGPDDAMYVVDYGEVLIDFSKAPPYDYQRKTGMVWKITKAE